MSYPSTGPTYGAQGHPRARVVYGINPCLLWFAYIYYQVLTYITRDRHIDITNNYRKRVTSTMQYSIKSQTGSSVIFSTPNDIAIFSTSPLFLWYYFSTYCQEVVDSVSYTTGSCKRMFPIGYLTV